MLAFEIFHSNEKEATFQNSYENVQWNNGLGDEIS